MTDLETKIIALAQANPPIAEYNLDRRIKMLERIADFYKRKADISDDYQSLLFEGFVSTLKYSVAVLQAHRKLTQDLKDLKEQIK